MKKFQIVDSEEGIESLSRRMTQVGAFAFDTETNTLKVAGPNRDLAVVGISISWGELDNYYIPLGHRRHEDLGRNIDMEFFVARMKPVFEREDVKIAMWNGKFDMHVMARLGIIVRTNDLFDGMVASFLIYEDAPHGLKDSALEYLGIKPEKFRDVVAGVPNEVKKEFGLKAANKATFDLTLIDESAPYALADAFNTWQLCLGLPELLEKEGMLKIFNSMYMPILRTVFQMEEFGVGVDVEYLDKMTAEINEDIEKLRFGMFRLAGAEFNPGSSQQLAELFFGYVKPDGKKKANANQHILSKSFGFPVIARTDGGSPSTGADVIWKLSKMAFKDSRKRQGAETAKLLLEHKRLDKLKGTFLEGLKGKLYGDGKMHPNFNIIGTVTGRFSCIAEGEEVALVGERKPIEQVEAGDIVYCYDDEKNLRIRPVLAVIDQGKRDCVEVRWVSRGSHDAGRLVCTPDHRLRLANGEWVRAGELRPGHVLAHLRVSANRKRPRLYGWGGICDEEQRVIKREWFGCADSCGMAIHHIDRDTANNRVYNLRLMTCQEHARMHGIERAAAGQIKTAHLVAYCPYAGARSGRDNPQYRAETADALVQMVHNAKGKICDVPMDFDTFKIKCVEMGVDYRKVAAEYRTFWRDVDDDTFIRAFYSCKGVPYAISRALNIGRWKVSARIEKLGLCYNHRVLSVVPVGPRRVYDLSVEEHHNFIASEVNVSNCSDPNLQQCPRSSGDEEDKYKIRALFRGSEYLALTRNGLERRRKRIISVDYSNLEMRCLAHWSKDENLLEMFAQGHDSHGSTAVNMFGLDCAPDEVKKKHPSLRQAAKTINFMLMYGGGANRLYESLLEDRDAPIDLGSREYTSLYGVRTGKEVAQAYIDRYFASYSGVAAFIRNQKKFAHRHGFVYTVLKRKKRLGAINGHDHEQAAYCERLAVNAAIQGTAADITINAQNRIGADPWFAAHGCNMLMQVHDELVFECPEKYEKEAIRRIRRYMEHPFGDSVELNLPLVADAGSGMNYWEAK
jgi:DNA polymerase I-like protein with 3'-5' exonuclease and polymerase domains